MCDLPCGVLVSRFKRVILGIVLNCTPQISHVGFQNQIVLCSVLCWQWQSNQQLLHQESNQNASAS